MWRPRWPAEERPAGLDSGKIQGAVRLCTFTVPAGGASAPHRVGRIDRDRVVELAAGALPDAFVVDGCGEVAEHALTDVRLLAPVLNPPSVRDGYAFEAHVANAAKLRGGRVPELWYRQPAFYFSNPAAIFGPDCEIPYPAGTEQLDYELEVAAIIGADGRIGGFTVMNDFSARDIQLEEMALRLGPFKGKDFATGLGPVVVTVDEFPGTSGTMLARVNGDERSRGELGDMYWSWDDLVEHAGRNTVLRPGDVIGSGTVGMGCILEHGDGRWLKPGDVVELEVDGIGILRNRVGPRLG
jgi:fumarylacetoacetate (FAA) hydrolase